MKSNKHRCAFAALPSTTVPVVPQGETASPGQSLGYTMDLKRRLLECITIGAALGAITAAALLDGDPNWVVVSGFALFVVLSENTSVFVHKGTDVSPSFMAVMAAIAV